MTIHDTIRSWLEEGRAVALPGEISAAFDAHIDGLPWNGTTGLDWSRMPPSSEFNLVGKSRAQVYAWIATTDIGDRSHMVVWYSRREGGIVVPVRIAAEALDELYWGAPGTRFAFGAQMENGAVQPFFTDLLQYGYGDFLIATSRIP